MPIPSACSTSSIWHSQEFFSRQVAHGCSTPYPCCVLLLFGCETDPNGLLRVSGQIEGTAVTAGSRVGGRVMEVAVEEGDQAEEGTLLVRLEDTEARALVDGAKAQVSRLEAVLAKVESGATAEQLAQAEAAVRAAEEQLRMAERGARAEEISTVQAKVDGARAAHDSAKTEFARAKRLFGEGAIPDAIENDAVGG